MPRPSLVVRAAALSAATLSIALAGSLTGSLRAQYTLRTFEKTQLSTKFFCEGATIGDLDGDGHPDLIAGPYWYAGPTFTTAREIYTPKEFDPAGYSDNFFAFTHDFDADGWLDILFIGFPGKQATWYRNPGQHDARGADGHWQAHVVFDSVDNESPDFTDLTGDGKPELVCQFEDRLGYATVDWSDPTKPWRWHPLSAKGIGGRFTHGLGVGDIDGDGRKDVLWKHGWWRQPESLEGDPQWANRPFKFAGRGGAQMLVYDIDGDGDNDVVTSENAHGYGLSWFEQITKDGKLTFTRHWIMGSEPADNPYGVAIGNLHAMCLADFNEDGLLDVLTGNRYRAHSGKDRADSDPPALTWFQLRRVDGIATFIPHEIDDNSGVGTQVVAGDADGDGDLDVVVGNKMGTFIHRQNSREVSRNEFRAWERSELARHLDRSPAQRQGSLAKNKDGKVLNFNFETGDLRDWTAEGDAFTGTPSRGDTVAARRGDMRSRHAGHYWVGTYEPQHSDGPKGTLTSAPFVLDQPYASFLIGGGSHRSTRLELVRADTGKVVFTASGHNDEAMKPTLAELEEHVGKELFIRLVDDASGHWGHINFDDFLLHAEKPGTIEADSKQGGFPAEEAVHRMRVPAGFTVQSVASEPDLHQPIAMTIDARGRLWIVEAFAYPQRRPDSEAKDTILVFEDNDGDGKFDERTVFADDLNLVSGIEVGFGGVFVGAAPYLYFIPDRNDDLVADGPPEVLLDGWHYEDTHETLNAFTWGPDGWLYGCHGVFTHSRVGKPGTPDNERHPLNAGVWRYHPTKHEFEVFAHGTSNPWGIDFDDRGQAFITACVIPHMYHMIQGGAYRRQSGNHFNPFVYDDIDTIADHLHYVGSRPHAGNNVSDSVGGGHAHCGAMIYRGGSWPEEFQGSVFMANLHGHRLITDKLRREGSGYVASHGGDFLLSNDQWFMAIAFDYDHDGNVFFIDWYDPQTCHLRDIERWDRTNGRIYKICHGDQTTPPVDLHAADTSALVARLFDDNEYFGRRARRLLQERGIDDAVAGHLHAIVAQDADETRRLRALWALHVTGKITPEREAEYLANSSEYVRAWTVQLALEDRVASPEQVATFEQLAASDPSPVVRLYLAAGMQRLPLAARWGIAAQLAKHGEDADDHNLPSMIWYGIEPAVPTDAERALTLAQSSQIPAVAKFIVRRLTDAGGAALDAVFAAVSKSQNARDIVTLLEPVSASLARKGEVAMPASWRAAFEVAAKQSDPQALDLAISVASVFGDRRAESPLRAIVADTDASGPRRRAALERLLRFGDAGATPLLLGLVDDVHLGEMAIRALASSDSAEVPTRLLGRWKQFSAASQRAAAATLVARGPWAKQLLDAVKNGVVAKSTLDATIRQRIAQHGDAALDDQLVAVWGRTTVSSEETKAKIAAYKKKFSGNALANADLINGRALFAQTCMACHTMFGQGIELGPDITGSNRADLDYILQNLVDPSAEMSRDYMLSTVHLKSGGIAAGMIRNENDSAITVSNAGIPDQVIPRKDIDHIDRLEISLMPPGQLDGLADDDQRDLLAYLATPQQVPMRATEYTSSLIFNGTDLALWDADPAVWSVDNGEIVGKSETGLARNNFAVSHLHVTDFELTFEVKLVGDRGNSGVQIRSASLPNGEMRGYQCDIGPGWWGKLYEEEARGLLHDGDHSAAVKKGQWNTYRILAEGPRVRTWINGQPCVDRTDPDAARSGVIGLQVHSGGPTEVRFRKLELTVK